MYKAEVEIYSDASNHAIMKHPGRNFPGSLLQGDSLYILCQDLDILLSELKKSDYEEVEEIANDLRNRLWDRLNHYQNVLLEHDIDLPFRRI